MEVADGLLEVPRGFRLEANGREAVAYEPQVQPGQRLRRIWPFGEHASPAPALFGGPGAVNLGGLIPPAGEALKHDGVGAVPLRRHRRPVVAAQLHRRRPAGLQPISEGGLVVGHGRGLLARRVPALRLHWRGPIALDVLRVNAGVVRLLVEDAEVQPRRTVQVRDHLTPVGTAGVLPGEVGPVFEGVSAEDAPVQRIQQRIILRRAWVAEAADSGKRQALDRPGVRHRHGGTELDPLAGLAAGDADCDGGPPVRHRHVPGQRQSVGVNGDGRRRCVVAVHGQVGPVLQAIGKPLVSLVVEPRNLQRRQRIVKRDRTNKGQLPQSDGRGLR